MFGIGNKNENGEPKDVLKQLLETIQMDDEVIKARLNDQRLVQLTEYSVTRGYTKSKVEPEAFNSTFAEYKSMIMRGSMTLRDLETDVFKRWGVQEEPREQAMASTNHRQIGFRLEDIEVADIPEDSEDNR